MDSTTAKTKQPRTSLIAYTTFKRLSHHPKLKVTQKGTKVLQTFVDKMVCRVVRDAISVCSGKTLRARDVETVARIYGSLGFCVLDDNPPNTLPRALAHSVRKSLGVKVRLQKDTFDILKKVYAGCTKLVMTALLSHGLEKRVTHKLVPSLMSSTNLTFFN